MARIDVSELMLDPDFIDSFTIVQRVPTINTYGENTLAETNVSAYGSVQSAGKETAARLPDGVQISNVKTIFTKAVIVANASGRYVDQIEWRGNRFNIINVLPWDNFGAGWFMIDCELERKTL